MSDSKRTRNRNGSRKRRQYSPNTIAALRRVASGQTVLPRELSNLARAGLVNATDAGVVLTAGGRVRLTGAGRR
jgi:ribosomal protein S19E (S16A)